MIGVGEDEGATREEYRQGVDVPVVVASQSPAKRTPGTANALFRGGWSGLFITTPDWHPIPGGLPGVERPYCPVGFSGHGFKMAPTVGVAA